jgi:hypothetical protein
VFASLDTKVKLTEMGRTKQGMEPGGASEAAIPPT